MDNDLTYIISPHAGDIESNVAYPIRCCRMAIEQGCTPIAAHLLYPQILNDQDPGERALGMVLGIKILRHCADVWVCGSKISDGMEREFREAERLGIPIRYVEEIE